MNQQQDSSGMGRIMSILAWLTFLGLIAIFFNDYLSDQDDPNRALSFDKTQQLVLKRNKSGHYIAPGEINGVRVQFLLDTGATNLSIPAHIAREAGLKKGAQSIVSTANGHIKVYQTQIDEVRLGGLSRYQVEGFINSSNQGDVVLLGMSFLKYFEWQQIGDSLMLTPQS
ncbi:retropepsin-like aspartic protease family protein [Echinimonas agarilytica]|uniref:TIGR02281 family clan AA aspartic protease n=1 Tax=Echinimonas agarilytica TaxID=1215918 RepID=A0AA41W5I3_9GAMM|nr:TIGR02281 family clan AA aspartic protease [Echinimonas agarilytica]MCM2679025.1 TIGR02281 family clan AA aspartic protease [Echinimonas agarilytica]